MNNNNYIYTSEEHCKGCNKCIFKCPVEANKAIWENDESKVIIKEGYCISCGECFSVCDHEAREFEDDTEKFFKDLENGTEITLVAAPSALTNFENVKKVFGFLKSRGIKMVFDVSYGADICTFGYVKFLKEKDISGLIAQPCPVVVSFVEKYHPELIDNLSPIQSPVICTAIYLKKYKNITGKIAFLSPCIGKKRECEDDNTKGYIDYNITFSKFLSYVKKNNINLSDFPEYDYDNFDTSWGFAFSRPGGLTENVRFYLGEDIWIKQIEGIHNLEGYFKQFINDIEQGLPVPTVLDVLNCEHGCNVGTGTNKDARINNIDFVINKAKKSVTKQDGKMIMDEFEKQLNIEDFYREYTDKSAAYKKPEKVDLENFYIRIGKISEQDRNINCFSCGYGSCEKFVTALAHGENHRNNCRQYILNKFKSLSMIDELTGLKNRYSFSLDVESFVKNAVPSVGIVFVDINGLKIVNDISGHKYGDELIMRCANLLKDAFPGKVYRVGGDEFVVLDGKTSEQEFDEKIASLRKKLTKVDNLMISLGDYFCTDVSQLEQHIEIADQRMYAEKQQHYRAKAALQINETLTVKLHEF